MTELPAQYRILPHDIDLRIPGFEYLERPGDRTLALKEWRCEDWFNAFVDRLVVACRSQRYLPVCRMSDGEYLFALGEQPPDVRLPFAARTKERLRGWRRRSRAFRAATRPGVSSGYYSRAEVAAARTRYAELVSKISQQGILALHLTHGDPAQGARPFQERYHPALARWLARNGITLTDYNYFPFYFVYAALTGSRRGELLRGKRLLVVTSAAGEKRRRIQNALLAQGASAVRWQEISSSRSLFDSVDVTTNVGCVDLAFVGAGVGKPNVLVQLEPLQVPCIDAGYLMEVWANDGVNVDGRPFCGRG
jgi:hypothetical protein